MKNECTHVHLQYAMYTWRMYACTEALLYVDAQEEPFGVSVNTITCKRVLKVNLMYELTLGRVHVDNVLKCATCVLGGGGGCICASQERLRCTGVRTSWEQYTCTCVHRRYTCTQALLYVDAWEEPFDVSVNTITCKRVLKVKLMYELTFVLIFVLG